MAVIKKPERSCSGFLITFSDAKGWFWAKLIWENPRRKKRVQPS